MVTRMSSKVFAGVFSVLILLSSCSCRSLNEDGGDDYYRQGEYLHHRQQPVHQQSLEVGRQSSGDGYGALLSFFLENVLPLALSFFDSSAAPLLGGSNDRPKPTVDRNEIVPAVDEKEDGFPWGKIISAGLKIVLTLLTSSGDGIDKSDNFPTQAILGTVISAVTGSEDASEVAKMAEQATEVLGLVTTLFETLKTSFTSR